MWCLGLELKLVHSAWNKRKGEWYIDRKATARLISPKSCADSEYVYSYECCLFLLKSKSFCRQCHSPFVKDPPPSLLALPCSQLFSVNNRFKGKILCIVDTNAWSKYNIVHYIGQHRVHPGIRCGSDLAKALVFIQNASIFHLCLIRLPPILPVDIYR